MKCPKCDGKGQIPMARLTYAHIEGNCGAILVPCDFEGCHSGQIHCCDGLIADGWEKGE